jgi:hypothetical protein
MRVRITLDVEVTDEEALQKYVEEKQKELFKTSVSANSVVHNVLDAIVEDGPTSASGIEIVSYSAKQLLGSPKKEVKKPAKKKLPSTKCTCGADLIPTVNGNAYCATCLTDALNTSKLVTFHEPPQDEQVPLLPQTLCPVCAAPAAVYDGAGFPLGQYVQCTKCNSVFPLGLAKELKTPSKKPDGPVICEVCGYYMAVLAGSSDYYCSKCNTIVPCKEHKPSAKSTELKTDIAKANFPKIMTFDPSKNISSFAQVQQIWEKIKATNVKVGKETDVPAPKDPTNRFAKIRKMKAKEKKNDD